MNEPWRSHCHEEIIQIIKNVAAKRSAVIDCNLVKGYPYLINDEQVTFKAIQSARNYLGESNVQNLDIRMASEDFAYYSQIIPSCFFRLGTGNKQKGITALVHTSTFDIDEKALVVGSGLLAYMAIEFLNS
jgi:metal-dependent amidase/aminoacylase/carboxypeptidase family protein